MKKLLLLGALALLALPPPAQAVTLGGQDWTGGGDVLTLTAVVPGGNQPQNIQCVICGANQPQQSSTFGYTDYKNSGGTANYLEFSTNVSGGGNPGQDTIGIPYDGTFLRTYLTSVGDASLNFSIGIDVNQANTAQTLESFYLLNFTQKTVLASFQGPALIPSVNNGTGFPDYTLTGFDIHVGSDIALGDQLIFFARLSGANDGPESFFLVPQQLAETPLPAAVWLFGSGLGGLWFLNRRKKKTQPTDATPAAA